MLIVNKKDKDHGTLSVVWPWGKSYSLWVCDTHLNQWWMFSCSSSNSSCVRICLFLNYKDPNKWRPVKECVGLKPVLTGSLSSPHTLVKKNSLKCRNRWDVIKTRSRERTPDKLNYPSGQEFDMTSLILQVVTLPSHTFHHTPKLRAPQWMSDLL